MKKLHIPVLLTEVLATLRPSLGESYLDLTAGYGGHAESILGTTLNYNNSILVDRDKFAVSYLTEKFGDTIQIINLNFYDAVLRLIECGKTFDLILADFGVSSPQLDDDKRGFSFRGDGPLDMRMDQSQPLTADEIVNSWSENDLATIFSRYGEEKFGRAKMLAHEIILNRPIKSTKALADIIISKSGHSRNHPATRIFQSIRIAVNNELEEIEKTLPLLPKLLKDGGRVGIITFHSLEDRLVKDFFKAASSFGEESELKILTKKPIVAEANELAINPRARSAKLRVAQRI
ncbi:MAG: 16S rRNA (cytosine(1402)-N(4))-methyltransferase RsmH [Candidatus Saccharibacteria bacterium]|nr:16S rRNA (cytosine(1402)-N(4))-methyltransferase RsmH [Candidatus Saccharibacteria bacterium]